MWAGGRGGARWLVATGAGLALVLPWLAGLQHAGYDQRRQFISELGAVDAPGAGPVSIAFGLVGLLLIAGGVALVYSLVDPRAVAWAAAVVALAWGASYLVSGVAPCDAGCPGTGEVSAAQELHTRAGVAGYAVAVGGVVAFAYAARGSDAAPVALGVALVVFVAGLASLEVESWRGALQRLGELVLLVWLVEVVRRLTVPPDSQGPLS